MEKIVLGVSLIVLVISVLVIGIAIIVSWAEYIEHTSNRNIFEPRFSFKPWIKNVLLILLILVILVMGLAAINEMRVIK